MSMHDLFNACRVRLSLLTTECRKTQSRKPNQRTLRTRPIVLCNVYRLAVPNGDGNHRSWPKYRARFCPSTLAIPTIVTTAATYNLGRVSAFRSTWRQSSWFRPTRGTSTTKSADRRRCRYLRSIGTRPYPNTRVRDATTRYDKLIMNSLSYTVE